MKSKVCTFNHLVICKPDASADKTQDKTEEAQAHAINPAHSPKMKSKTSFLRRNILPLITNCFKGLSLSPAHTAAPDVVPELSSASAPSKSFVSIHIRFIN